MEIKSHRHKVHRLVGSIALIAVPFITSSHAYVNVSTYDPPYPRLMAVNFGGDYGAIDFQQYLAKFNVVVLSTYGEYTIRGSTNALQTVVRGIKSFNPDAIVANYTIFNEQNPNSTINKDLTAKINAENWWLRKANGACVGWTTVYGACDLNIMSWMHADSSGMRYPEWRAQRDYNLYTSRTPELDMWYIDITVSKPPTPLANFKLTGVDIANTDAAVGTAYRQANVKGWNKIRALSPNVLIMGNVDRALEGTTSPEYHGKLNGGFLEGLMGKSWSLINSVDGWNKVMKRYRDTLKNTIAPKLVGFGINIPPTDYKQMRFALGSVLLDNGYLAVADVNNAYKGRLWFDEFDFDLGNPVDGVQTVAWSNGVYRRTFQKGMALVNPTSASVSVTIPAGYRRLLGTQDPVTNNGQPVTTLTIPAKDGIILKYDSTLIPPSTTCTVSWVWPYKHTTCTTNGKTTTTTCDRRILPYQCGN